jgi:hypothetical protein
MNALPHPPSTGVGRLVSEACDPAEFVRAAVAWDRARVEAEVERELRAALLLWETSFFAKARPPRGCRPYANFLARLREWIGSGVAPRYARRDTRELLLAVSEALVRRGQMDPAALAALRPRHRHGP